MGRTFSLLLLVVLSAVLSLAQSGRRVTTSASTPSAPIQPPLTKEAELPPRSRRPDLFFLTESFRERQIRAIDNGSFRLADFHEKVIVINIWASWCPPCRR